MNIWDSSMAAISRLETIQFRFIYVNQDMIDFFTAE